MTFTVAVDGGERPTSVSEKHTYKGPQHLIKKARHRIYYERRQRARPVERLLPQKIRKGCISDYHKTSTIKTQSIKQRSPIVEGTRKIHTLTESQLSSYFQGEEESRGQSIGLYYVCISETKQGIIFNRTPIYCLFGVKIFLCFHFLFCKWCVIERYG